MTRTKKCKKCQRRKRISDFYPQVSNKDGLRTCCKSCELARYVPVASGFITCKACGIAKLFSEFTPHRTQAPHGRSILCKICRNDRTLDRRRLRLSLRPVNSRLVREGLAYITRPCQLCQIDFQPIRHSNRFCNGCSNYWRRIGSSLTSGRGRFEPRAKVNRKIIDIVARAHFHAINCAYCGREFSEALQKSIDHRIPLHAGGTNDPSNIEICCIECNRSKAWLSLADWQILCSRVTRHTSL